MALFSNKKARREAKEAAGQQQQAAIYGMEAASAQATRQLMGQEAQANIFNALGQPGTYGQDAGTFQYGDGSTNMWDLDAAKNQDLKKMGSYGGRKQLEGIREGIIDPEGYANQVMGSIPFQMRSQQTAEAMQLLNKEGPAWDELYNATIGTIHEGAALQLRDTMRQIRNNHAKGGSARKAAANEYTVILAQERAMRSRTQESWQANLRLHSYVRQNADRVEAGNRSFVENINGLSQVHMAAMQATAALQVEAGKTAGLLAGQAYEIRASQKAQNFGRTLLEGVIMAAASSLTDGLLGGTGQLLTAAGDYTASRGEQGTVGGFLGDLGGGILRTTGKSFSTQAVPGAPQYTATQQAALDRAAGNDLSVGGARNTTTGGIDSWFSGKRPSTEWRIEG